MAKPSARRHPLYAILAGLFPNPESCLRLVSVFLCEQDEDWQSAKIYLSMNVTTALPANPQTKLLQNEFCFI